MNNKTEAIVREYNNAIELKMKNKRVAAVKRVDGDGIDIEIKVCEPENALIQSFDYKRVKTISVLGIGLKYETAEGLFYALYKILYNKK